MSSIQGARAIGLVRDGRIREDLYARTFVVRPSGAPETEQPGRVFYRVTLSGFQRRCDCPAGHEDRLCYHVRGVRLLLDQSRRQAPPAPTTPEEVGQQTRVAEALAGINGAEGLAHDCREFDEGDGCTACWSIAWDLIRAYRAERACPTCRGRGDVGGLEGASTCDTCGGDGVLPLDTIGDGGQPR